MSISSLQPDRAEPRAPALRIPVGWTLVAISALALVVQWLIMPNANIAWLLTVAERMLDGQTIYVDTIETNPPFSIWLYLPAAWLGRLLHLRPEWIVQLMVLGGSAWALRATIRPLRRAALLDERSCDHVAIAAATVLLLLPAACFGEREHFALIAFLPFVARASLRASGKGLSAADVVVSALCIAIILAIKPHFAAAIGLVALACAWSLRSWRLLLVPEYLCGASLAAVYAGSTLLLHPAFWSVAMPLNAALYLPVRYSPGVFLWHFSDVILSFIAILAFSARRSWSSPAPLSILMSAGAMGFLLAVVVQGKGMPYHFYPALALAVHVPFASPMSNTTGLPADRIATTLLACIFWTLFNSGFDLREAVLPARQAADHPKVLSLGYDFSIGPPVARAAGGTYVGRTTSQWIADNAEWLKTGLTKEDQLRTLDDHVAQDRRWFVEDLIEQRPDVLFVQRGPDDWQDFAKADPRYEAALRAFDHKGQITSQGMRVTKPLVYDIWIRRKS